MRRVRTFLLMSLLASGAWAGDYIHSSGRVALDKPARKYESAEARASGWRPLDRATLPADALDEIRRRDGRLDPDAWTVPSKDAPEAPFQVVPVDPEFFSKRQAEIDTGIRARKVDAYLELLQIRYALAQLRTNPPAWATEDVITAAETELLRRRDALVPR